MPEQFNWLDHTDKLTSAKGKDRYICPSCSGNNLQVDSETGKAQCWNGCDLKVIRDLIAPLPQKQVAPRSEQVQACEYFDRDGNAAICVNRLDKGDGSKDIWQSFWHLGGWQAAKAVPNSIKAELKASVMPYLYDRATKHEQIFWVEGEKCADALWSLGLAAVTSIGGCDGLNRYGSYAGLFDGKELVICPDMDKPGLKYADGIAVLYPEAKRLYAFPNDPRWRNLPVKDGVDIADWIAKGVTKEQILAAIEGRPEQKPESREEPEETPVEQIKALLNQNLPAAELEAQKIALRGKSRATEREFEQLWQTVTDTVENDIDEINDSVNLLLSAQQSKLELKAVLPAQLATPLDQLSKWQNLRPELYLLSLLVSISSQIKNGTTLVLQRAIDFEVTPNLFGAIVAESSQKKSPLIKTVVKKPLRALAVEAKAEHEYQKQEWERQKAEAGNNKEEFNAPEPALRVHYFGRATGESILRQASRVPEQGLLCLSDEIAGYFKSANQYRQGRGSDAEDLLEYYDGAGTPVLRADGLQSDVDSFNFSMLGGIQPKVLQKLLADCEDSNGNWARWIFIHQPTVASTLPDEAEGFDVTGLLAGLYQKINLLPAAEYKLSREAFKYFQTIYNKLESQRVSEPKPALRAAYGKTSGRIGKLALNLHLIEAVVLGHEPAAEVSLETVKKAVLIAKLAIDQIRALYTEFGGNDISGNLAKVVELSRRKGEIKARDVNHALASKPKAETVRQWFAQLTEQGWGMLGGSGIRLTFTAYPDGRRCNSSEPEPLPEPAASPQPSPQPEPAASQPEPIQQGRALMNAYLSNQFKPGQVVTYRGKEHPDLNHGQHLTLAKKDPETGYWTAKLPDGKFSPWVPALDLMLVKSAEVN